MKYFFTSSYFFQRASPSLRGSGLKSARFPCRLSGCPVSLFTREWIEIPSASGRRSFFSVSLFTREWIEIFLWLFYFFIYMSPSLRGSGLKYRPSHRLQTFCHVSLFTREWIEMPCGERLQQLQRVSLFTREWIEISGRVLRLLFLLRRLPLYEGVD